jgi:hypothetical protein
VEGKTAKSYLAVCPVDVGDLGG